MEGLYTNQTNLKDYVINAIYSNLEVPNIYIAVAFFTEADVIEEILKRGCHLRLIVRLGFPTSPYALKKLINNKQVQVRFFTSSSFHPKLYIFGDKSALIGSANLTRSAINSNQEVVVSLNSDDERFTELEALFSSYWSEAKVLQEIDIAEYEKIYSKSLKASNEIEAGYNEVINKFGDIEFSNIERGKPGKPKEAIFLESYQQTYQEAVNAFAHLEELYKSVNKRKVSEETIPLRLEVDSFFSYVRDHHAIGEMWREANSGWTDDQKNKMLQLLEQWFATSWPHLEETIAYRNYPAIKRAFSSPESISALSIEDIVETLTILHSFYDRLRFYGGGLEALKKAFVKENDIVKVKASLTHLIFGNGDIVKRMSDLIFDQSFKLNEFGKANVQELVGWVSRENLPVVNGRTTKVMRYFGFEVQQL